MYKNLQKEKNVVLMIINYDTSKVKKIIRAKIITNFGKNITVIDKILIIWCIIKM